MGIIRISTNLALYRYAAASILRFTYDYNVDSDDDCLVYTVGRAMSALDHAITPGAFLADTFPAIRKCIKSQTDMSSLSMTL